MHFTGKRGQKRRKIRFLCGPQALKINRHAGIGILAHGIVGNGQLIDDLLHRRQSSGLRRQQLPHAARHIHIDAQVQGRAACVQISGYVLIAAGNGVLIPARRGGGKQRGGSVPGHPAPPGANGFHPVRQAKLVSGGDGVEPVDKLRGAAELFINAYQHGGSLPPGCGCGGGESGFRGTGGHADLIGHGHVALPCHHIGKRKGGGFFLNCGRPLQSRRPDQHLRHLGTGDGHVRAKFFAPVHHVMGQGRLHHRVPRVGGGHVGKGGL